MPTRRSREKVIYQRAIGLIPVSLRPQFTMVHTFRIVVRRMQRKAINMDSDYNRDELQRDLVNEEPDPCRESIVRN
jgi:hypothetical protein